MFTELEEPMFIESENLYINEGYILKKMNEYFNQKTNITEEENKSIIKAKILAIPDICNTELEETYCFYSKFADLEADNSIFTNKVLGILVNFIWENQAKYYFRIEFFVFFFFFVLFNVNFAILRNLRIEYQSTNSNYGSTISEVIDVLLFIYALFCLVNETRQFFGSTNYFKSIWNYFDIMLIPLLLFSSFFDYFLMNISDFEFKAYVLLGYSLCMFCFWFRFLSFFRGIRETSSMIRLILNVISGVKYFVLFMVYFC